MTECQKLIAYKQAVQAAKSKLKQMPGIEALGLVGLNGNPRLSEIFSAYTSTYDNDVESPPYGCMMEIPGASCSLRQI